MKSKWILTASLAALVSTLFAQMPPPPENGEGGFPPRGERPQHGGRFGGGPGMMMPMTDVRAETEAELAKKYPEEFARLVKARAEAEKGMQDLAKKAGLTLPEADFARREKMAAFNKKYEAELKEINELRKTDPRTAMKKYFELMKKEGIDFGRRPGGMQHDRRMPDGADSPAAPARMSIRERLEQMVKKELPDDYAQYEALRKTDPRAADAKLRELARKIQTKKAN